MTETPCGSLVRPSPATPWGAAIESPVLIADIHLHETHIDWLRDTVDKGRVAPPIAQTTVLRPLLRSCYLLQLPPCRCRDRRIRCWRGVRPSAGSQVRHAEPRLGLSLHQSRRE